MKGKRDSYRYKEDRNFKLEDGRLKPGYMMIWQDEFMHLWTGATPAALALYVFVGTRVGGNRAGFDLGGQELQHKLKLKRSTLYDALKQLVDLRMATRTSHNGQTVIRLTDAWRRPVQNTGNPEPETIQETGRDSSSNPDNKEKTSSESKLNSPPICPLPDEDLAEPRHDAGVQSPASQLDQLTVGIWRHLNANGYFEMPKGRTHQYPEELVGPTIDWLNHKGWRGTKRRRDIATALKKAAALGPDFIPPDTEPRPASPSEQHVTVSEFEEAVRQVEEWRELMDNPPINPMTHPDSPAAEQMRATYRECFIMATERLEELLTRSRIDQAERLAELAAKPGKEGDGARAFLRLQQAHNKDN